MEVTLRIIPFIETVPTIIIIIIIYVFLWILDAWVLLLVLLVLLVVLVVVLLLVVLLVVLLVLFLHGVCDLRSRESVVVLLSFFLRSEFHKPPLLRRELSARPYPGLSKGGRDGGPGADSVLSFRVLGVSRAEVSQPVSVRQPSLHGSSGVEDEDQSSRIADFFQLFFIDFGCGHM